MWKELSGANIEIKDIFNFFKDKVLQLDSTRQKYWQAIIKAEDFLEFSMLRLDPHHIFCAIFNKTKRKRSVLPISKMFLPTPINALVLMMLRLGIYVSLCFKDVLWVFTCYSFLSNRDWTCLELFSTVHFSNTQLLHTCLKIICGKCHENWISPDFYNMLSESKEKFIK